MAGTPRAILVRTAERRRARAERACLAVVETELSTALIGLTAPKHPMTVRFAVVGEPMSLPRDDRQGDLFGRCPEKIIASGGGD